MGVIKTTATIVLTISFIVFVALFGRLPVFRKTPIGFLHRLLLIHTPKALWGLDQFITGGSISRALNGTGDYLMNEAHPIVLIFFLGLLIGSELLFIPSAWSLVSWKHQTAMLLLSSFPYVFLYLCTTTTSNITHRNHHKIMTAYPYDYSLFHPGHFCRTCEFPKPARSKHCPLCKACVQKQDHHCVWVNNCVGRNNYIWFLLLLVTTSLVLLYGATLGYQILDGILQERFVPSELTRGSLSAKKWSTRFSWSETFDVVMWAISMNWQIGAVTMLAFMAFPLSTGFWLYHVYLLWAGMTTNESSKWADWREDIVDGLVYRASLESLRSEDPPSDQSIEPTSVAWPTRSRWWIVLTRNGEQPTRKQYMSGQEGGKDGRNSIDVPDLRWQKVRSVADLENIYDLGFIDNIRDVLNRG